MKLMRNKNDHSKKGHWNNQSLTNPMFYWQDDLNLVTWSQARILTKFELNQFDSLRQFFTLKLINDYTNVSLLVD